MPRPKLGHFSHSGRGLRVRDRDSGRDAPVAWVLASEMTWEHRKSRQQTARQQSKPPNNEIRADLVKRVKERPWDGDPLLHVGRSNPIRMATTKARPGESRDTVMRPLSSQGKSEREQARRDRKRERERRDQTDTPSPELTALPLQPTGKQGQQTRKANQLNPT